MTATVALIGANGHGRWHRRVIAPMHRAGELRLVGMCDLAPITDQPDAPVPPGVRLFQDYRELLAATAPEVVVICTPPHTHLEIATAAARAGADLLLEKPPLLSSAEQAELALVLVETGRVCQVGFQALGSAALAELTAAIADGRLGRLTGVGAAGAWQRPDSYYQRAPWAGRRRVDGRPVLDGALANPFAHAVMESLAVVSPWPAHHPHLAGIDAIETIEVERYRARPIEVDDTAAVRFRLGNGMPVVVAATLCGDEFVAGEVIVHGERGRAVLVYPDDLLQLPGDPAPREVPGRTGLLANLLAHRGGVAPLLAPLARTAGFTAMVDALTDAPAPAPIDPAYQAVSGEGPDRVVTLPGASALMRKAASRLALLSELADEPGAGWAAPAGRGLTSGVQTGTEQPQD